MKKTFKEIKGVVINGFLNLRKGPSKDYEVIQILNEGTEVIIDANYDDSENWYSVIAEGKPGYVMKNFIKVIKENKVTPTEKDN